VEERDGERRQIVLVVVLESAPVFENEDDAILQYLLGAC